MRLLILATLLVLLGFAAPAQAAHEQFGVNDGLVTLAVNYDNGNGTGNENPPPNIHFLNICVPALDGVGCLVCIGLAGPGLKLLATYTDPFRDGLGVGVGNDNTGATFKVGTGSLYCPQQIV